MSIVLKAIGWNRQKKKYDLLLLLVILTYCTTFTLVSLIFYPEITAETLLIRCFGSCAFVLLHLILMIGPLARIDPRFLPLVYNRRHAGVILFVIALAHGVISIFQFHALGNFSWFTSLFLSNPDYHVLMDFPFQTLGFFALIIFMVMALTSHDFWMDVLSPKIWKLLHMSVYVAYLLLIFHVLLGTAQLESSIWLKIWVTAGLTVLLILHLWSAVIGRRKSLSSDTSWVKVGSVDQIKEGRAVIISANNQEIAIFKYDGIFSAVRNECKHQLGPLGEGRIIDGCITCPWHGYQYLPANGCSPPPFQEKISTYRIKVENREIWVNPTPYPEGTFVEPAKYNS